MKINFHEEFIPIISFYSEIWTPFTSYNLFHHVQFLWFLLAVNNDGVYFRDQDAEVELDDVWFAYPSRPNYMVLKVVRIFIEL